jgi:hypothetical protein
VLIEGDGKAGVMLRGTGVDAINSMYECTIDNAQQFECWKQVDGTWSEMVPIQTSDAIVPNAYNSIIIGVEGNQFVMQINGVDVANWTDDALPSGAWGLYVQRPPGSPGTRAYYDVVLIYTD